MKFKDILHSIILENYELEELGTKEKDVYGAGVTHQIYKAEHSGNLLYKTGPKGYVDQWYDIFKNNPKYFPIVHKRGNLKKGWDYVGVERLDTQRVKKEWAYLEEKLTDIGFIDEDNMGDIDNIFNEIVNQDDVQYESDIINKLKTYDKKAASLFLKWTNFLSIVKSIVSKVKPRLDLHIGNFGYSPKGEMKCLDI